jgi:rhamnosyltransferase
LWLKHLVQHFDDPDVAGVYGRQLPHEEAWPYVKRDYYEFYGSKLRVQRDANQIADHCFSNAASALRKNLWERHRFDEALPYCEDWEWARAMLRFRLKIVYEPNAVVYHSHNECFIDVYRRSYREASARRTLYGQQSEIAVSWLQTWRDAVLADIRFIRQHGYDKKWCFWSILYRFYWSCGRSLPTVRG